MRGSVFAAAWLLLGACTARRSEPLRGAVTLNTEEQRRGQQAYFRHCHNCHPGGEAGLGPALNDKLLPPVAIKAQVRLGVGAMPAIPGERLRCAPSHVPDPGWH